jgi:two-component system nitrate/nitrite response regulator NarL
MCLPDGRLSGGRPGVEGERVRIIIADTDPLARRAIADALRHDGGFRVLAAAGDGRQAIALATQHGPDLLLTEVALAGADGITVCREVVSRASSVRVVMISVRHDQELQMCALRAGAVGFLYKDLGIESILRALRAVANGEAAVPRSLTLHLLQLVRSTADNSIGMRPVKSPLTTRECEVLDLICAGHTTREISGKLFLAEDTIYSHAKRILRKLGVHSRSDAIAIAAQLRHTPLDLSGAQAAGQLDRRQ